ncbi:hypothetical protein TI24_20770 [Vibrio vulnificus]|nr:hypothetical protein VVCECT4999_14790 [Vibrio vulnificus]KGK69898.1 hypothetical protein NA76_13365 [Vibrio vulnificus]PNG68012.1 hypothetical protein TI24_20770 [Vibrio vulnificus]PNG72959.1 hypothetical protein TI31_21970 [Vibrio vulnificus]
MRIEVLFFLVEHKKEPKNSLFFFVGKRLFLFVREQTKDEYGRTLCGNKPRSWQWGNVADITLVDLRISVNRFGPEK